MPAPRKYNVERQQRATRMAIDARRDPESVRGAGKRVADQLGVHPRGVAELGPPGRERWRGQGGHHTDDAQRLVELEREVRELRRANEVLKTSVATATG